MMQWISELDMEFILVILFDIFIELVTYGGQEELEKQRFSRPVRFILIGLYLMVFIGATGFIILAGILVIRDYMFLGIILLLIAIFFVFEIIREIKKAYSKKNNAKINLDYIV